MFDIIAFDDHLKLKPFGGGPKSNRLNNMYPGENEGTNAEVKEEVENTSMEGTNENVAAPNGEPIEAEKQEEAKVEAPKTEGEE